MDELLDLGEVELVFKNFEGRAEKFNPVNHKNFCVVLADKKAKELEKAGFNIRRCGSDFYYLRIRITGSDLYSNDIKRAKVVVYPFRWQVNGRTGIMPYLHSLESVE